MAGRSPFTMAVSRPKQPDLYSLNVSARIGRSPCQLLASHCPDHSPRISDLNPAVQITLCSAQPNRALFGVYPRWTSLFQYSSNCTKCKGKQIGHVSKSTVSPLQTSLFGLETSRPLIPCPETQELPPVGAGPSQNPWPTITTHDNNIYSPLLTLSDTSQETGRPTPSTGKNRLEIREIPGDKRTPRQIKKTTPATRRFRQDEVIFPNINNSPSSGMCPDDVICVSLSVRSVGSERRQTGRGDAFQCNCSLRKKLNL
ncbi:hypothetical protein RRG08_044924 [Elysia crispata]|uniref:Uncharacterized protein n=1 Tax=Elysia crispata TaxID=231223 RepID=A0AAE0ZTW9_9GAST|nr:hypothetical protein RRG08_044924 [Elysia crispata]